MQASGLDSGYGTGSGAHHRGAGAAPVSEPRIKQEPADAWGAYGGAATKPLTSSPPPAAADLSELRRQQQQQRARQREQAEGADGRAAAAEEDEEEDEGADDELDIGAADDEGGAGEEWAIPPGAQMVESRCAVSGNSMFLAQAANAWFNNAPAGTAWQATILVDRRKANGPFSVKAKLSTKNRWRLTLPLPEIKPHFGCRVRRFVLMKVGLIHIFLDSAPGGSAKPAAGKSPAKRPAPAKRAQGPPAAGPAAAEPAPAPAVRRWSTTDAEAAAAGDGEAAEAAAAAAGGSGGGGWGPGRTPLGHQRTVVEVSGKKSVTGMVIKDAISADRPHIGSMRMSKVFMDMQPHLKPHAHHAILYIRIVSRSPAAPAAAAAAPKIIECPEVLLGRSGQVWELKRLRGALDPFRGQTVRAARWLDPQGEILRIEFEIAGDPAIWEEGGGAAAAAAGGGGGERSEGGASAGGGGGEFGAGPGPADGDDGHSRPGSPLRRQPSGGWAGGGGGGPPGGLPGGGGSWGDGLGSGSGRGFDKPPGLPPTGPSGGARRYELPIPITASTTLLQLPEAALSPEVAALARAAGVAGLPVAVRAAAAGGAAVAGPAGSATGAEAWLAPTQKTRDAGGRPLFCLSSQAMCSQVLQRHVGWAVEAVEAAATGGGLLGRKPRILLQLNPTPPHQGPGGAIGAQHPARPAPPPAPLQQQPSAAERVAPAPAPAYAAPQEQQQQQQQQAAAAAPPPAAVPVPPALKAEAVNDVLAELIHVVDALPQEPASGLSPDWLDRIMAASSRAADALLQGSNVPANQLLNRYEMVRRMCQQAASAAAGGGAAAAAWVLRVVVAINNVAALEPPRSHSGGGSGAPPSGGQHSGAAAAPGDDAPIPSLQAGGGPGGTASAHTGSSGQR